MNNIYNAWHPFSDRAAEQIHPEREDSGDADGAGQLRDVQGPGQLPRGLPERPEAGKEKSIDIPARINLV